MISLKLETALVPRWTQAWRNLNWCFSGALRPHPTWHDMTWPSRLSPHAGARAIREVPWSQFLALPFGSLQKMSNLMHIFLGGLETACYFHPYPGERIQFDSVWFFQTGWFNHQLVLFKANLCKVDTPTKKISSSNKLPNVCLVCRIQALASKAGAAPKEGQTEAEAARSASEESSSPLGISVGLADDKIQQPVDMGVS